MVGSQVKLAVGAGWLAGGPRMHERGECRCSLVVWLVVVNTVWCVVRGGRRGHGTVYGITVWSMSLCSPCLFWSFLLSAQIGPLFRHYK